MSTDSKYADLPAKLVALIFNASCKLPLERRFNRFELSVAVQDYLDDKHHNPNVSDKRLAELGIHSAEDLLTVIDTFMISGAAHLYAGASKVKQTDPETGVLHLTRRPYYPNNVDIPLTGISVDGYRHHDEFIMSHKGKKYKKTVGILEPTSSKEKAKQKAREQARAEKAVDVDPEPKIEMVLQPKPKVTKPAPQKVPTLEEAEQLDLLDLLVPSNAAQTIQTDQTGMKGVKISPKRNAKPKRQPLSSSLKLFYSESTTATAI